MAYKQFKYKNLYEMTKFFDNHILIIGWLFSMRNCDN